MTIFMAGVLTIFQDLFAIVYRELGKVVGYWRVKKPMIIKLVRIYSI